GPKHRRRPAAPSVAVKTPQDHRLELRAVRRSRSMPRELLPPHVAARLFHRRHPAQVFASCAGSSSAHRPHRLRRSTVRVSPSRSYVSTWTVTTRCTFVAARMAPHRTHSTVRVGGGLEERSRFTVPPASRA